ncbi:unnamed protein product, partial [Prorocentrum cordatum]
RFAGATALCLAGAWAWSGKAASWPSADSLRPGGSGGPTSGTSRWSRPQPTAAWRGQGARARARWRWARRGAVWSSPPRWPASPSALSTRGCA